MPEGLEVRDSNSNLLELAVIASHEAPAASSSGPPNEASSSGLGEALDFMSFSTVAFEPSLLSAELPHFLVVVDPSHPDLSGPLFAALDSSIDFSIIRLVWIVGPAGFGVFSPPDLALLTLYALSDLINGTSGLGVSLEPKLVPRGNPPDA
jgi:hypothetical protein